MSDAIHPQGAAIVSCDIVGHSDTSVEVQVARVRKINDIVAKKIDSCASGAIVWSSGGDGGHVVFGQESWGRPAVELLQELYEWSDRERVRLRIAAHYGEVTYIEGADGRVQPIGEGINYAGWLLSLDEWSGAVVSDTFRAEIEKANVDLGVEFHQSRFIPNIKFDPHLLCPMSTADMPSSWVRPEPGDRLALELALQQEDAWDVLYYVKRIWQVNSADQQAVMALGRVQPYNLRYSDARGSATNVPNPFFAPLQPDELKDVLQPGQLIERRRGDVICRYNESGDTMFVILRGEVGVYNSEGRGFNEATVPRHVLKQGEIVGELAYALSRNRTADLVALTDVALLSFNYKDIRAKSTGHQVAGQVSAYINYRVLQHACDNAPYLLGPERNGPLAVGAPSWDFALTVLRRHAELIDVDPNRLDLTLDMLKPQEAEPRGLYILAAGEVREQRSGSKVLRGADFPVLWVDIPNLLTSPPRTYEVQRVPVKILHIAAQGIDELQLTQRQALRRALPQAASRQTGGYEFDVFLCHSKKDSAVVREIYRRLVGAGIACWFDERHIRPSSRITSSVEDGLRGSRFLLACLSSNFADSVWAKQELQAVLHLDMKRRSKSNESSVLVLMLNEDDDKDDVIPLFIRDVRRHTYTRDGEFDDLIEYITATRAD